jgi:hypothetical protein
MRYGTKGGSPVVSLVEDDIHHHAANTGSASNSQVVAAGKNCGSGAIVCESVELMFSIKGSRWP